MYNSTSNLPNTASDRTRIPSIDKSNNKDEKEAEKRREKQKREADEAFRLWLSKKKKSVIRRYSPEQPEQRELKWYENKKRMFELEEGDMEPKRNINSATVQRARQVIQHTIHQPKRRVYSGSGKSFDEWLRTKQTAPRNDETEKEAEKRKADELRQMMAQEKFKQWLDTKIEKRKEETRSDQEQYEETKQNKQTRLDTTSNIYHYLVV